jgi:TRAP-type C4-dicarboxylate transport system substrate-binding protein
MARKKWDSLPPVDRQIFERGVAIWEKALAERTQKAVAAGLEVAKKSGVEFHDARPEDQRRFDELYLRQERRNASSLSRYGIDGMSVFETARSSVEPDGTIECEDKNL